MSDRVGAPWATPMAGRLDRLTVDSHALRGNPLGDPHVRPLLVYSPPGYDDHHDRRYPSIYVIQGLTGQLDMWENRIAFRPTVPELVDGLFADPHVPPCVVVFVDCWTSLGGSQYLDSPGTGNYHSYLCDEVVRFVDQHYRTMPDRDRRAISGKSSGGYGAMVTPMLRPDVFGGLATRRRRPLRMLLPARVRALRAPPARPVRRFLRALLGRLPLARGLPAGQR